MRLSPNVSQAPFRQREVYVKKKKKGLQDHDWVRHSGIFRAGQQAADSKVKFFFP